MEKEEKIEHVKGKYLIITALIGLVGTFALVYKDMYIEKEKNATQTEKKPKQESKTQEQEPLVVTKTKPSKADIEVATPKTHSNKPDMKDSEVIKTKKMFILSVVVNEGDQVEVKGKSFFTNATSSESVRKYDVLEGEEYDISISNCEPIKILITSNLTLNRCN